MFNRTMNGLLKAISLAGGQAALAAKVGIGASGVSEWKRRGNVPPEMVLRVCEVMDFEVSPNEVRPDIYPHPHDGLPENRRRVRPELDSSPAPQPTQEAAQ
jgi:DNA-binding transcriptional regulator YdaS (Cro superfamily)